ncbi:MAG: MauE/DoxX family redox-associated membrane protein [Flagellimonas sp.]
MKWNEKYRNLTVETISLLFVMLFVYAATSKLWDFQQFKVQLGQSPILTAYAGWLAWLVPLTEYLLVILLLQRSRRLSALYAAFGLMVMFTTYIILVLNFSDYIPCSCGGVLENLGWTEHIVFNLFFIALALIGIILLEARPTLKPSVS